MFWLLFYHLLDGSLFRTCWCLVLRWRLVQGWCFWLYFDMFMYNAISLPVLYNIVWRVILGVCLCHFVQFCLVFPEEWRIYMSSHVCYGSFPRRIVEVDFVDERPACKHRPLCQKFVSLSKFHFRPLLVAAFGDFCRLVVVVWNARLRVLPRIIEKREREREINYCHKRNVAEKKHWTLCGKFVPILNYIIVLDFIHCSIRIIITKSEVWNRFLPWTAHSLSYM